MLQQLSVLVPYAISVPYYHLRTEGWVPPWLCSTGRAHADNLFPAYLKLCTAGLLIVKYFAADQQGCQHQCVLQQA